MKRKPLSWKLDDFQNQTLLLKYEIKIKGKKNYTGSKIV